MMEEVRVAVLIFVVAPVLLLIFIGLVPVIMREIEEGNRRHRSLGKSVQALIDEVSGYGDPPPDPLDIRVKQLVQEGQQQVEDEVMANFDKIVTIMKETNHR